MIYKIVAMLVLLLISINAIYPVQAFEVLDSDLSFESHQVIQIASEQFNEVIDQLQLKDLANPESQASSTEDLLNLIRLGDKGQGYNLSEELEALVYIYEENELVTDLYFLFYQDQLIYSGLFDYSFPKEFQVKASQDNLISYGFLNYQGEKIASYQQLDGHSPLNLTLLHYMPSDKGYKIVSEESYFQAIQAGHERQLLVMLDSLNIDMADIRQPLQGQLLDFQEGEQENVEKDASLSDLTESEKVFLLDNLFVDKDNMTDYALLLNGIQSLRSLQEERAKVNQSMIVNTLGQPYSIYQEDNNIIMTYVSEWYGYYLQEYVLIGDELTGIIEEFHHLDLFPAFPKQIIEQVTYLEQVDSLTYADLLRVLGPAWQITDDFNLGRVSYSWMRYGESSIDYIIFTESPTEKNLSISTNND